MSQPDIAVADPKAVGLQDAVEELDPDWPYDRLEFAGDNLAIRLAPMQALMAYQLSGGKFISMEKQNDASGLFISNYIGPDSYDRITFRMMDADDPTYDMKSFAKILGEIVKRSVAKLKEEREAKEAAEKAAKEITTSG